MSNHTQQGTLNAWLSSSSSPRREPHAQAQSQSQHVSTTASASQSTSTSTSKNKHDKHSSRREALAAIAAETRMSLPAILAKMPTTQAAKSEALHLHTLPPLIASNCPRHASKARIRVVNEDTFNAAIALGGGSRVAILSMASHSSPGGGWLRGAFAQEEMLCYRSSLYLSLHRRYYPWKQRMGLYTPDVVVIRGDMPSGHKLLDPSTDTLPVVSALSIAALRTPPTKRIRRTAANGGQPKDEEVFADAGDRALTKDKMRLCLRMAASRGHDRLVLGALGCGAFRNPPREVAKCWLEVLGEAEFGGGWWRDVVFAVYDTKNDGNFGVFEEVLDGQEV